MKTAKKNLFLFLSFIILNSVEANDQDDLLLSIFDEDWIYRLEQNPVYATSLGVKGLEAKWRDISLESFDQREMHSVQIINKLNKVKVEELSKDNQLNFRLFKQKKVEELAIKKFDHHLLPFSHRGGIQLAHESTESLKLTSAKDYRDWLERINNLDINIQQTIILARQGIKEGFLAPRVLMDRVYRQIQIQSKSSLDNHPFLKAFKEMPDSIASEEREKLINEAQKIIVNKIIPAYQELDTFFVEEYLPSSRATVGIYDTPNGKDYYRLMTNIFTTTTMTPEQVHNLGLNEVKRIKKEMMSIIEELNFDGNFQDFLSFLRTDKRFYFQSSDELFRNYLSIAKRIDPELTKLFKTLPRTPYGLKPIPIESAPDTTTAYYMPPSPDGRRPGYYYVNLYKPETRPKYEMEVLTVHEAMPGHHLQISLALEKEDLPMFRRMSPYTVFVEGWGLYSEVLGYELGLYKDPYSRFGQLTYDMWRAVRLVVDTGIHFFEWDRQQAIDFFMQNAGKSKLDIINEVDRYINWPGQALAYKVGQLKILELRAKAQESLGNKFKIREFHDALLGEGALPLNEVEIIVNNYINLNQ